MFLVAKGNLGEKVRTLLVEASVELIETDVGPPRGPASGATVFVTDSFCPELVEQAICGSSSSSVLVSFLTTRGLFVSPWLSSAGPCFACFKKRWFGNLSSWEHKPEFERYMQRLDKAIATRSFPIPHSVAAITANLLADRIRGNNEQVAHYMDLASCEIMTGVVLSIHGCLCIRERMSTRRSDIAKMFIDV